MDVQMTMNFLWVFCLAIGLVKSAPVEGGVKPTEKVTSSVEEELLSLPKAKVTQEQEVNQPVENIAESPDVEANLPADPLHGENGIPIETGQGKIKIAGLDEVFQSPAIDLSPRAVAEYLILTGDFTGFDLALFDLIRARVLSPAEVQRYKDAVGEEYKKMLKEMLDAETSYLQAFNALYGLPVQNGAGAETLLPNPAVVEEKTVQLAAAIGDGEGLSPQSLGEQPRLKIEELVQATGGRAVDISNKDEDLELQTLLEWMDNEMQQEMQNIGQQQPVEPAMEEAAKPATEEKAVETVATEVKPEKPEDAGQPKGETLENRDSNGKMMIKNVPQDESEA